MKVEIKNELETFAKVEEGKSFADLTTLHIGGPISLVIYPESLIALDGIMRIIDKYHLQFKVIGKGSNILASDDNYEGIVIRFDRHFNDYYINHEDVYALAGTSTIALSNACMKAGLSGLEFSSGIPGTVGGNVFMNAGAYKSCIADIIQEVFVYRHHRFEWIRKEECAFSYRHSIFKEHNDWIILAAHYRLTPKASDEIEAVMSQRKQRRLSTQPLQYPSCGSVFKNPEGYYSWQLIENIGYRGKKIGGAMVSEKHANFILNVDHAKADDYLQLINEIKKRVKNSYGVSFLPEVEMFNWLKKKD